MKSTTNIWIALRNIGDSQDRGDSFNGTLSESILWLATKLRETTMAGRLVMGIGRTQEDALRGIDVKHAGKSAINDDVKSMLDSVFDGESDEADIIPNGDTMPGSIPGDTYVA